MDWNLQRKTDQNKNNSNNNNDNLNAYREFMPYWSREEDCYKEDNIVVNISTKNDKTVTEPHSYPRIKPGEQIAYEDFMGKITNPLTHRKKTEDYSKIKTLSICSMESLFLLL